MKKILFPTDFSSNADHALRYAIGLCESLNAELILFHSCRADAMDYQMQSENLSEESITLESINRLRDYREKHLSEMKNLQVIEKVIYGLAVDTIVETAAKMKVDMIIMGTKGASGLQEVLLGSNTAAVMERAKCPVLAIPEKSLFRPIEQMAFATDFRENDIEAIVYLSSIASLFNAKLIIVHVADILVPDNYENALFDVFKEEIDKRVLYKNITFEVIKGANAPKAMNEFVKERKVEMVAVSTRKKNVFTRLFDVSFTKQLAYHSVAPVMAFHPTHS